MSSYTLEYKPTSNTSPRSKYGAGPQPKAICIHHWGSDGQDHDNVVGWLRGPAGGTSNRGSSAHYVTSAGRVTKLADHDRATWHAGSTRGNGEDIGIECRPEMSDGDWRTLVELCADIEETEGSLRYRKHSDHKPTACPGRYSDRIEQLVEDVNAEHERRANGTPAPAPAEDDDAPAAGKVPGPGYAFPLDDGEFFGPPDWGDNSVSGWYRRVYHGRSAREWLQEFGEQLMRRGWSIGIGESYLAIAGNDGLYGPEYADLIGAFQREQGLTEDDLLGPVTWNEAFHNPVT